MPYLLVHRAGGETARHAFDRPLLRAGGSAENEICLSGDATASRHHATFGTESGRYFVEDAASRSGTRVNGEPVSGRVELRRGDRVTLGRTVVHFLHDGDPEPAASGTGEAPGESAAWGRPGE